MAIRQDLEEAQALAAVAAVAAVSVEAVAATAEAAAMPEAEDAGAIVEHPIRPGDSRSPPKFKRGVTTMTHSNHDTAGGDRFGEAILVGDEEKILRCLGAAAIMKRNTLPTKL